MGTSTKLEPHLIVKDAARAIQFYVAALGAEEISRAVDAKLGGKIVHAELRVGDCTFSLAEEWRESDNDAPPTLGGSPVVLALEVENADAVFASLCSRGAEVLFPLANRFYGKRDGRVRDPFGHMWIVSQTIEALTPEEVQRRVDALSA